MILFDYLITNNRYMSLVGVVSVLMTAVLFSNNRKKIKLKLITNALLMQTALAFIILRTRLGRRVFEILANGFRQIYSFADEGAKFLFGGLANTSGPWGMIFAIKVIPIIVFFGALMSLLFHLGIVQLAVRAASFVIRPILGTSGAETLCAAANSMLGQTEAPLLIRHYLKKMTNSELLVVMVSGMGTLSGAILAAYGAMGVSMLHLLAASAMAVPGSILISKILIPETLTPATAGGKSVTVKGETSNALEALSQGTTDGLRLAANVAAMLITFISLMALVNFCLSATIGVSLNQLFAYVFSGVAYLLGVSWADCNVAGAVLGQKIVINEFIAYSSMVSTNLLPRSKVILTYALAGFSNFSCIGIQIGGIGALEPEKRSALAKLGMTALLGGTLTNFLNAAIAGLFI